MNTALALEPRQVGRLGGGLSDAVTKLQCEVGGTAMHPLTPVVAEFRVGSEFKRHFQTFRYHFFGAQRNARGHELGFTNPIHYSSLGLSDSSGLRLHSLHKAITFYLSIIVHSLFDVHESHFLDHLIVRYDNRLPKPNHNRDLGPVPLPSCMCS